jgi:adhesin transport system membrane fusion protein
MSSEISRYRQNPDLGNREAQVAERLASWHIGPSWVVWTIVLAFVGFVAWAMHYRIDEVTRATGEVIASSRVQIIQSVDGGVIKSLHVREGDRVTNGQIIAELDETRVQASVGEMQARLAALVGVETRLSAEVTDKTTLVLPSELAAYPDLVEVEQALFQQRTQGFAKEVHNLQKAIELAKQDASLVKKLARSGDVNQSEVIRVERALNEAEAKLISRRNRYYEEAQQQLSETRDEIAQTREVLTQREQQLKDSVFRSKVEGIVKNVRVTTVGGVLRAGEELMQIIPVNDELILEAKVSPADISRVETGQEATVRFDPFDYTIYGGVQGEVVYVSADTLKEDSGDGVDIYYRVHVKPTLVDGVVISTVGKVLQILPGMTAQVDIRAGDRTVMEFLLKPIRKTLSESFGER